MKKHSNDDIFGGIFDFNNNGHTSPDEEFLGFMIIDEIERANKETDQAYSSQPFLEFEPDFDDVDKVTEPRYMEGPSDEPAEEPDLGESEMCETGSETEEDPDFYHDAMIEPIRTFVDEIWTISKGIEGLSVLKQEAWAYMKIIENVDEDLQDVALDRFAAHLASVGKTMATWQAQLNLAILKAKESCKKKPSRHKK